MSNQSQLPLSSIQQGPNLHVMLDGEMYVANRHTHPRYEEIVAALRTGDIESLRQLLDIKTAFATYASNDGTVNLEVRGSAVYVDDEPLHDALGQRLFEMARERLPIQAFVEFLARKNRNPSARAQEELFGMLEHNVLPITVTGHFHAYKAVRFHTGAPFIDALGRPVKYGDLVDIRTGTFRNNVGDVNHMPREEVCDDKTRTCAPGLHFTSLGYATNFGGSNSPIVIVEIDPADVVSIPIDYNHQKGRACRFRVVHLHNKGNEPARELFDSPVSHVGVELPEGDRFEVASTAEGHEGEVLATFATRDDAQAYCDEFADTKIVDRWALAKLAAAEAAVEAKAAEQADD